MSLGQNTLELPFSLPLRVSNGGLFVSRGEGRHPSRVIRSFELIFVCSGVLKLCEEQQLFTVRTGETLLLWPERQHQGVGPYPEDLAFYWLHFLVETSTNYAHLDASLLDVKESPRHLSVPQHSRVNRPDHLTSLFRRFLDDQETLKSESPAANLLVLLMLYEITGFYTPEAVAESSTARLAGRAHTLIRTQFHKPLSTSRLAKRLHSNPDYLGRVFHQHYGCTLTQALHQRRLKYARKLLLESDRTVDMVAFDCGFNDTGYFRRVFKRSEGMTPHAFRKLYNKIHINTE